MTAPLLPCAHCGGEAGRSNRGTRTLFHVYCQSCDVMTRDYHSQDKADAAWNRRAVPAVKLPVVDLEEVITDIIEKGLTAVESHGFIVPACESHERDCIVAMEDGSEGCSECIAEGGVGEICHLGLDSVAIELAGKILAALKAAGIAVTP